MQLVAGSELHEPFRQYGVEPEQAVAFCQVPVELHVCGCVLDEHWVWPGPHVPTHAPATHVWLASQFVPFCQVPVALHVCGC